MNTITDLRRAISAEIYKLRHSSIPVTIVILPLAIVVLMNLVLPFLQGSRPFQTVGNQWLVTGIGMIQLWGFLQAFIVAVVTAQLAGLEHGNNTWKHLFALPISRKAIYYAKVIVGIGLFSLSSLLILVSMIVTGLLLNAVKPDAGFGASIPWGELILIFLANHLATWLIISIQTWAGTHWSGFGPAMGVAMVGFLLTMFLANRPDIMRIYPWTLPFNFFVTGFNLSGVLVNWEVAATSVLISVVASLIIIAFSARQVTRRDVM
jgi:lantibiotic transport system permease protein